ncbi:hypothetical protein A9X02_24255 [Mycobacterium malmoense]|nr:hypothetical protein [Mycobacterium malmoense]OCB32795.1 hypothetical protein A9X02_24255 [Mycobacterium malmoense]
MRIARELRNELSTSAFLTLPRSEITGLLRQVSKEPASRIGSAVANDLTHALLNEGVLVYPALARTSTGEMVRLYHAGTVLARLIDAITEPDHGSDQYLGDAITKLKGKWQWDEEFTSAHLGAGRTSGPDSRAGLGYLQSRHRERVDQ